MKERSYRMFAEDVLEAMDKIERYTRGLTYETFVKNEMVVDAVMRNLEIIGDWTLDKIGAERPQNLTR